MAAHGRPTLRDLFDDSPTPHIAHPPRTHHRHFYVATDGSYRRDGAGGGLGAVIETRDGTRVARVSLPDTAPNNNVAEYRALHLGLDVLAARTPGNARVGVLVDHDDLAAAVNSEVLAGAGGDTEWRPHGVERIPPGSESHWRGIRARIAGFDELRAARIDGRENPAHPLANAPQDYAHVNRRADRCVLPDPIDTGTRGTGLADDVRDGNDPQFPPPSRFENRASD
ncbi:MULTISPECIES: reverse transcriptase-like protein [Halobellus]|uniref:reverse transcriptase-like protein n=1 Tax=Halobellus TaxID=1073986 RepID=UPI002113A630|nr:MULTISPECIES: reverse transcriptase-like protein [Halobellus]MDQ2054733.1 reverse transcriptase-like protein [Halobellus sp. H-GB7]